MSKSEYYKTLLILCLVGGLTPLATDLYLPVIPQIAKDLHTSVPHMQLTVSIFFAGFAIGQLIYGPLADTFGRKKTILIGATIFFLTTIGATFANSFTVFFIMRAAEALGGAAGAVVINAIMRDLFKGVDFVKALTFTMLTITIAPLIAPTIGGFLSMFGWRIVFALLALLSFIVICVVVFGLKETLIPEYKQSIKPKKVLANYLDVFKNKRSLGVMLAQTIHAAGMFSFISGSPFVYIEVYKVDPKFYGLLFGMNVSCILFTTYVNSLLVKKIAILRLLRCGLFISATGGVLLLISALFEFSNIFSIVIPVICYLCVVGLIGSNSTTYVMNFFRETAGTASAAIGATRFGMGALAGILLNLYPAENAVPMAVAMCSCGLLANFAYYYLRRLAFKEIKQKYKHES